MPERRSPTPADPETAIAVGEIRAQLRELIHGQVNDRAWREAATKILAKLEDLPEAIEKISIRIERLEHERAERAGASNVWVTALKSPALGWLIGAVTTVWAFVTGRLHL